MQIRILQSFFFPGSFKDADAALELSDRFQTFWTPCINLVTYTFKFPATVMQIFLKDLIWLLPFFNHILSIYLNLRKRIFLLFILLDILKSSA